MEKVYGIFSPFFATSVLHRPEVVVYTEPNNNQVNNPNDVFVWVGAPDPIDPPAVLNSSAMKAVQLPRNYGFDGQGIEAYVLGNSGRFQSELGPVFGNGGRQVHWNAARGEYRIWQIDPSSNRFLNQAQTTIRSFGRNPIAGQQFRGGRAAPVLGPSSIAGDS